MPHRNVRVAVVLVTLAAVSPAAAHVSPPLRLLSDRDARQAALPQARSFTRLTARLSPEQKRALKQRWHWQARTYNAWGGRAESGIAVGTVYFLTEATLHGPVTMAVGVDEGGRVTGAAVVEVSEEAYGWVRTLLDRDVPKGYVGLEAAAAGIAPARPSGLNRMEAFYAEVLSRLVQRAAALHAVGLRAEAG